MRVQTLFADQDVRIDGPDVEVTGLAYDSRKVVAGGLFAALRGERNDGHTHVDSAIERGASALLVEQPVDRRDRTQVLAKSSRLALAKAARRWFSAPSDSLTMVGITGTNGKTTTAHLVAAVLAARAGGPGNRAGIIGTLGASFAGVQRQTGLTTPESLELIALLAEMRDANIAGVAMEVSSHALDQERVAGVDYDVAVFTNLTHDHLDYHGTLESYFAAKSRLFFERMKAQGRAVINIDDAFGARLAESLPTAMTVSAKGGPAAVRVLEANQDARGTTARLATPGGVMELRSPLVGGFNLDNLVASVGVGVALEMQLEVIAQALAAQRAVPGRLERVGEPGQPLVLVDYAHTPDALEKALRAARGVTAGRLLCVFGCGGDRDPKKRGPMGALAVRHADHSIVTSDNPRSEIPETIAAAIVDGARAAGGSETHDPSRPAGFEVILDRAAAIRRAIELAGPTDTVLVAGKGHEDYQIIGNERRHFDDREEAAEALRSFHPLPHHIERPSRGH